jgi:hypothetical protein
MGLGGVSVGISWITLRSSRFAERSFVTAVCCALIIHVMIRIVLCWAGMAVALQTLPSVDACIAVERSYERSRIAFLEGWTGI